MKRSFWFLIILLSFSGFFNQEIYAQMVEGQQIPEQPTMITDGEKLSSSPQTDQKIKSVPHKKKVKKKQKAMSSGNLGSGFYQEPEMKTKQVNPENPTPYDEEAKPANITH